MYKGHEWINCSETFEHNLSNTFCISRVWERLALLWWLIVHGNFSSVFSYKWISAILKFHKYLFQNLCTSCFFSNKCLSIAYLECFCCYFFLKTMNVVTNPFLKINPRYFAACRVFRANSDYFRRFKRNN